MGRTAHSLRSNADDALTVRAGDTIETMELHPVQVECYAGHKADETPRRFRLQDSSIEVEEVLDRWHQGSRDPGWPEADYFKVMCGDGCERILKHDLACDDWFPATRGT